MTTRVNFEIAKLLKEKGYDEECNSYFSQALFEGADPNWEGVFPKGSVFQYPDYHHNSLPNTNDLLFTCSAPTIAEVVMWLYEEYGIWVEANYLPNVEKFAFIAKPLDFKKPKEFSSYKEYYRATSRFLSIDRYETPTEAYSAGIEYTLKNLI